MKRKYYIPLGILCLFVVTNPSISAFKAYIGQTDDNYKCTANYFIFSTYRWHSSYVGVLGNFWRKSDYQATASVDTGKVVGDTTKKPSININDLPYKERVYFALKDNLKDFNTPITEFNEKIKDKSYALKVYSALKDSLTGFNKTQAEFLTAINE